MENPMPSPLSLRESSFCAVWPVIDDRAEWDRLVNRTYGRLSSLSQIEKNTKYYCYLWWHSCWETLRESQPDRPTAKKLLDRLGSKVVQTT